MKKDAQTTTLDKETRMSYALKNREEQGRILLSRFVSPRVISFKTNTRDIHHGASSSTKHATRRELRHTQKISAASVAGHENARGR